MAMSETHTKQVILVRTDLNMPPGKVAAQVAHASVSFLTTRQVEFDKIPPDDEVHSVAAFSAAEWEWMKGDGFTKIVLQVLDENFLRFYQQAAYGAGLTAHLITDSGRTVFDGVPTVTCLAIGPDESEKIDKVTGHLELL
jgi:PTH2 family peptidyl-tRNA hydrolase